MLKVLKPGLWTSIQDRGRLGYRHFGVPAAGCMDQYSADLANSLLNNSMHSAVLEMTVMGASVEFQLSTNICICGADMSPKINLQSVNNNSVIEVVAGDVLSFGHLNYGARAYLAIKGGFQTELEMESRSYYQGVTDQKCVAKGDLLDYLEFNGTANISRAHVKIHLEHFSTYKLECLAGPEYASLNATQKTQILQDDFSLSKNQTRMGFQLNEPVENSLVPILSSGVLPGTVQLTPSGKVIILMRDCQSTGGYPRILQLSEKAINRLAQKKPGDQVQFSLLDV